MLFARISFYQMCLGSLGFTTVNSPIFYQSSVLFIQLSVDEHLFASLLDFLLKNKKINTAVNNFTHFLRYCLPHNFTLMI